MAMSFFSNLYRCGSLSLRNCRLNSTIGSQIGQMAAESMENPVAMSISNKLLKEFNPAHLEVLNESYMHNVPKGAETHFKVIVVSEKFENLPLIKVAN
uniref:Uncharacterized protein n=1 Tax=Strigamia maritima TaxID=126957 RepID=T1JF53_STRMM